MVNANLKEKKSERFWQMRRPAQFLADVAILSGAFFVAYLPAVNIQLGDFYFNTALGQLPLVILVQFASMFLSGAYSILWRYVGIEDVWIFVRAALISGGILVAFRFILIFSDFNLWQVPVSVIMIDTVLGFGGMLGLRVLRRLLYEFTEKKSFFSAPRRIKRRRAIVAGASRAGAALARESAGRADSALEICGFVDDDSKKHGASLSGYKVLGSISDIPRLVEELAAEEVIIAIDQARGREIRKILETCGTVPIRARIIPSLNEIAEGRVSVNRIRDVRIEDLLGREPVQLDDENIHEFLAGKCVMITGAGGSIGSELVRQAARYGPRRLLLLERSEFMLFQIGRECASEMGDVECVSLLADIGDEARMGRIFRKYQPDVVLHAAAHKHVPLMETNAAEAVKNNVFATLGLGRLAGSAGVAKFVLVSTDKAVNPTSVMGASKRAAEIVLQNLNNEYATRFMAVRFGNVLGSAGSVVPIFQEQIKRSEPVTVTDPDMTRYFMTIPEASQLVLQAGALGRGGEIFILDMGEPVKILGLAEDMIRLSGLVPYEDIDIVFSGVRPGEKLFEELEISGENLLKTTHPKIFIGKIAAHSNAEVWGLLDALSAAVHSDDEGLIRKTFTDYLPEAALEFAGQNGSLADGGAVKTGIEKSANPEISEYQPG